MSDTIVSVDQVYSYAHSSSLTRHLTRKSIRELIEEAALECPYKTAFIFPSNNQLKLTFQEVHSKSKILAQNLLHLGFKRGDLLAISVDNTYQVLTTFFACASIGVVSAFFNQSFRVFEYEHLLKKTNAKALLIFDKIPAKNIDSYNDILKQICLELESCEKGQLNSTKFPSLKHVIIVDYQLSYSSRNEEMSLDQSSAEFPGCWLYEELASSCLASDEYEWPYVDADDPLMIHYTSGTTGTPKGAVHRQFCLVNQLTIQVFPWTTGSGAHELTLNAFPMLHATMPLQLISALINRTTLVFPFKDFLASEAVRAIEAYRCASLLGSARMLNEIVDLIEGSETKQSTVKNVFVSGSMVSPNLVELYVKKLGVQYFGNGLGMTEAMFIGMNHSILNQREKSAETLNTYTLLPYLEAKVVDEKTGQLLPLGSDGILCIRGYSLMLKYWDEPAKTREAIDENGWLNTGDMASMAKNGRLTIKGRQKETIKIYDSSIYPFEIESYLNRHENVKESCVFSIKADRYEEVICAWVVLKSAKPATSIEEIRDFCKANFAETKVPRFFKFVEDLRIQTSLGKAQRSKLAEAYKQELNI